MRSKKGFILDLFRHKNKQIEDVKENPSSSSVSTPESKKGEVPLLQDKVEVPLLQDKVDSKKDKDLAILSQPLHEVGKQQKSILPSKLASKSSHHISKPSSSKPSHHISKPSSSKPSHHISKPSSSKPSIASDVASNVVTKSTKKKPAKKSRTKKKSKSTKKKPAKKSRTKKKPAKKSRTKKKSKSTKKKPAKKSRTKKKSKSTKKKPSKKSRSTKKLPCCKPKKSVKKLPCCPKRSTKKSKQSNKKSNTKRRSSGAWNTVRDKKGSWHLHKGHYRQKIVVNGKARWVTRRSRGKNRGSFERNVSPHRSLERDLATHARNLNRGGDGGRSDSRYVRKTNRAGRKGSVRKASR